MNSSASPDLAAPRQNEQTIAHALDALAGGDRDIGVAVSGGSDSLALLLHASAWARARKRALYAVTVDHGLRLEAAEEAHRRGMLNAMGAPNALRGQSYSGNLSARNAHAAGVLDLLAADYHPSAMLPALLVLAETDPDGLAGAARLTSLNPARALGLEDRGEIRIGLRADLAVASRTGVGQVHATFSRGRVVHADGTLDTHRTGRRHEHVIRMS